MTCSIRLPCLVFISLVLRCSSVSIDTEISRRLKRQTQGGSFICPEECICTDYGDNSKEVNCYNTGRGSIPLNIPGDTVKLNLSRNSISEITRGILDNLHEVLYLDLSHNDIENIELTAFKDLAKVTLLDLSSNEIKNVTLSMLGPTALKLEVLRISDTQLRSMPDLHDRSRTYMTKLTYLTISNNRISVLPPGRIPPSVKFLDLSCLDVRVLKTNTFSGLENLEEVTMRGCRRTGRKKLEVVERGIFSSAAGLQRLDFSGNALKRVPAELPITLIELDLSVNRISDLKEGECATEEVLKENLYRNAAGEFDEFGGGYLTRPVGSDLSHLSNLRILKLNGNPLTSLCIDDFLNLEDLKVLNMSGCTLSLFHPHTFVYPQNLAILDLSGNQFMRFKTQSLSALEELYLEDNILEEVGSLNRKKVPSLKRADFAGNKWRCDCQLKPFLQLIRYHSGEIDFVNLHGYSVHYACAFPLEVKGKPLLTLDIDALVCDSEEKVNIVAIAAPASLGLIIIIVVIIIVVAMRQDRRRIAKKRAARAAANAKIGQQNEAFALDFTSTMGTTLERRKYAGDAAVLCSSVDQSWVTDRLIPEIRRHGNEALSYGKDAKNSTLSRNEGRLVLNVFTVGKNIKIDRLSRCMDSNRRVVIVVSYNFIEEDSSTLLLNVIRERSVDSPEDSVIILVLGAVAWSSMPQALKFLMVEKTFIQYPQDAGNDAHFWESLCPQLYRQSTLSNRRENLDGEKPEYWQQEEPSENIFAEKEDETPPSRPPNWNTGGRKMRMGSKIYESGSTLKGSTAGSRYGIIDENADDSEH